MNGVLLAPVTVKGVKVPPVAGPPPEVCALGGGRYGPPARCIRGVVAALAVPGAPVEKGVRVEVPVEEGTPKPAPLEAGPLGPVPR